MLPGSTKASNFSRQVRNPDFYKIHNLKIFICWLKLFFRTLAGLGEANKTSLCSRCSPWGIGLQLLLKYSFWNNLVYMVWFYGFYLICISSSFLLNIASHWLLFHSFLQLSPTSVSPAQIPQQLAPVLPGPSQRLTISSQRQKHSLILEGCLADRLQVQKSISVSYFLIF